MEEARTREVLMRRVDGRAPGVLRLAIPTITAVALAACEHAGDGGGGAAGQTEIEDFERNRRIGEGGEVRVRLEDGNLHLLDARPNDGWIVEVDGRSGDEVAVAFSRTQETWGFDAEVNDGRLEVQPSAG